MLIKLLLDDEAVESYLELPPWNVMLELELNVFISTKSLEYRTVVRVLNLNILTPLLNFENVTAFGSVVIEVALNMEPPFVRFAKVAFGNDDNPESANIKAPFVRFAKVAFGKEVSRLQPAHRKRCSRMW